MGQALDYAARRLAERETSGTLCFQPLLLETRATRLLAVNTLGYLDIRVTQSVLLNFWLMPSRSIWPECHGANSRKTPLLVESAGSETPQVVARFPGQIGMRVCTCEICHRPAYACVHRG